MWKFAITVSIVIYLTFTAVATADAPLPEPTYRSICSSNDSYCVEMDPKKNEAIAYKSGSRIPIWKINGWFRVAALSNDGETFFVGYDGMNLLPSNYKSDMTILSIFRHGILIKKHTLKDVILNLSNLQRTSSHYYWGDYLGFDLNQNYIIKTVEGRTLKFGSTTGELIEASPSMIAPRVGYARYIIWLTSIMAGIFLFSRLVKSRRTMKKS